jgi:tryptophanyl-tRNA synthetase
MLRAHSFKDAEAKNSDINMGVFNYPILMAADILGYGIDLVPVGQDQRQHLEMARDIARAFNRTYETQILIEPEEFILPEVATIPGLDGRKMSKSYNNFIGVFEEEKVLKKKIATIVTDSRGVEESKDPDTCNVF